LEKDPFYASEAAEMLGFQPIPIRAVCGGMRSGAGRIGVYRKISISSPV
jgi:hypothetical protein